MEAIVKPMEIIIVQPIWKAYETLDHHVHEDSPLPSIFFHFRGF